MDNLSDISYIQPLIHTRTSQNQPANVLQKKKKQQKMTFQWWNDCFLCAATCTTFVLILTLQIVVCVRVRTFHSFTRFICDSPKKKKNELFLFVNISIETRDPSDFSSELSSTIRNKNTHLFDVEIQTIPNLFSIYCVVSVNGSFAYRVASETNRVEATHRSCDCKRT